MALSCFCRCKPETVGAVSRSWGAETAVCGLVALMRSRSISRLYTCYAPEAAGSVQRVQGRVAPFCSPRCFHLSSLFSPPFFRLPSLLPFSPSFSCSVLALRLPPSLLRRGPSNPLSSPEYRRILNSLVSSPVFSHSQQPCVPATPFSLPPPSHLFLVSSSFPPSLPPRFPSSLSPLSFTCRPIQYRIVPGGRQGGSRQGK